MRSQSRSDKGRTWARARAFILLSFVLLLGVVVVASPAKACSCAAGESDPSELRRADVVFVGTADHADVPWFGDDATWSFDVDTVFKGAVGLDANVTGQRDDGINCGSDFASGTRYLVFADRSGDELRVEQCSPSRAITAESSIDLPNALAIAPVGDRPEPDPFFARKAARWVALILVVFAIVVMVRRQRRSSVAVPTAAERH